MAGVPQIQPCLPAPTNLDQVFPMALQSLIFDLDGVLVDTVSAHYESWDRVFTRYGHEFGPRIYREKIDGTRRNDAVRAIMRDAPPDLVKEAGDLKNRIYLELIDAGKFGVFESSVRFVRQCQNLGFRLATASSSSNVRYILGKAGILDAFSVVLGGDDVANGKPHPEVFLTAAGKLGSPVEECVVFEDATAGVQAAKSGGFYCVGVRDGGDLSDLALADEIVATLGDVDIDSLRLAIDQQTISIA
jgi:beta-phosphoglucomutase